MSNTISYNNGEQNQEEVEEGEEAEGDEDNIS